MSKGQEKAAKIEKPARKAYRDYTPEEKAAYKAKRDEAANRKEVVVKEVVDFVKSLEEQGQEIPTNVKNALNIILKIGAPKAERAGKTKFDFVAVHFMETDSINEDQLYMRCKVGRNDMKSLVKRHLLMATPADRIWVQLNLDTNAFEVLERGPFPPTGWRGFVPADCKE